MSSETKAAKKAAKGPVHNLEPRFFDSVAAFRAWLTDNHTTVDELVLGFNKLSSGLGGLKYKEAVDEALCFGWIDGHGKSLGETAHAVRFTPRRPGSIWSAVNLKKMDVLLAAGKVEPAGLAAYEKRDPKKQQLYSFEQEQASTFSEPLAAMLAADAKASAWFAAQAPGYRKVTTFWVMSAKQEPTRVKRMATLVASSHTGKIVPHLAYGKNAPATKAAAKKPKA